MKTKAAILVSHDRPLIIDEIQIPTLKPGQVLVSIEYSGICHTQTLEIKGFRGKDNFLPHLLGHEGSGEVIEVGSNVKKVKVRDKVILSWIKGAGLEVPSTQYVWGKKIVNSGAITTFSNYSIISENRLTVISQAIPMEKAALIGCAIPTGVGSVLNVANPQNNQSLAVFGCGGIGMLAIQAAKIANCYPIIGIDINDEKLFLAKKYGASHVINTNIADPIKEISNICALDFAIEATGNPIVMNQALESVKNMGGCAIIVGNAQHGKTLTINPRQFNLGKRIIGTWGGDNDPETHFSKYIDLISLNKLDLTFASRIYNLEEINHAFADFEQGKVIRPIIYCKN